MLHTIAVEPHALLDAGSFVIRNTAPLAELTTPEAICWYRELVHTIAGVTVEDVALT